MAFSAAATLYKKYLTNNEVMIVLIAVALAFVLVPLYPDVMLYSTDNLIVRGGLIALCVGTLYYDMLLGIFVFLLVARMFLERNNRKLGRVKAHIAGAGAQEKHEDNQLSGEGEIKDTEAKVDRHVYSPSNDEHPFMPGDELGDSAFHPVGGSSLDEKRPLTRVPEGEGAASSVFGDVHPEVSTNSFA